jgi:hypothetical protein
VTGGQHGRLLAIRDVLTLTALTDGNHTLFAKAVDVSGALILPLLICGASLTFQGTWLQQVLASHGQSTQLHLGYAT